jgi:hypothetical protein
MKDKASDLKRKSSLGVNTEHRMRLYARAAAAASVSTLALTKAAEATIVITNTNIPIHAGTPVLLDLNGDGIADFEFNLRTSSYHNIHENYLYGYGLTAGGGVIGQGQAVSAMIRGAKIGAGGPFLRYGDIIEKSFLCTSLCGGATKAGYVFSQQLYGDWAGGHPNRFVGVKFKINGETHYGWVRLTVTVKHKGDGNGPTGKFSATITEYGYESVANKSCGAGLPGASEDANVGEKANSGPSLGMLAVGAEGLQIWREED